MEIDIHNLTFTIEIIYSERKLTDETLKIPKPKTKQREERKQAHNKTMMVFWGTKKKTLTNNKCCMGSSSMAISIVIIKIT